MQKTILTHKQLFDLVSANKYKINEKMQFLSRCIDGRYKNSSTLPALALPGADAGQLMVFLAAGRSYGFEVDQQKAYEVLTDVVGGEKDLQFHTDHHAHGKGALGGCGHVGQASIDLGAYKLEQSDVEFVKHVFSQAKSKGAEEVELQGDHGEGAVILVKGNFGILPQFDLEDGVKRVHVQVFVFHKTLVDKRTKELAKRLFENKAVIMLPGCDEEYLYEVLSTVTEEHLMETAKRLAKGLPIYEVTFDTSGEFEIVSLGNV